MINMKNMFYNCSSLQNLNISNFTIKNDTDKSNICYGCPKEIKEKASSIIEKQKQVCLIF